MSCLEKALDMYTLFARLDGLGCEYLALGQTRVVSLELLRSLLLWLKNVLVTTR